MMVLKTKSQIRLLVGVLVLFSALGMTALAIIQTNTANTAVRYETMHDSQVLSEVAVAQVQHFYSRYRSGNLTLEGAKRLALESLRMSRYNHEGYFWVTNATGVILMHPTLPEYEGLGVDAADPTPSQGLEKKIIRAASLGGGFIEYVWPTPNDLSAIKPKVSYVRAFEPWDWIIGTGIYEARLQEKADELIRVTLTVYVSAILILLALSLFIGRRFIDHIEHLSLHDDLTGLPNRRFFNEAIDKLIAWDERHENAETYLTFLDIDRFKHINDEFGHQEGDRVLKEVANRIQSDAREADLVCRFGGEEFLILARASDGAEVLKFVERIRQAASVICGDNHELVTLSAGVVRKHKDETVSDAVKRADDLMYRAKEIGRDCTVTDQDVAGDLSTDSALKSVIVS